MDLPNQPKLRSPGMMLKYRSFGYFASLLAAVFCAILFLSMSRANADQNWDGDDAVGNFSFADNWFGDTIGNPSGFGFANGSLHFSFRNNAGQSSIFYDFAGFADTNDIVWDSSFGAGLAFNGNGQGLNFNQRLVNNSSFTQTIGSSMKLSGAKNGATQIELNPANGDLVFSGTMFNDNSRPYFVFGGNGHTLTLNSVLGVGGSAASVSLTDASNNIVIINALQTYTGDTTIKAGRIELGTSGALGATGAIAGAIKLGDTTGANAAELRLADSNGGFTEDAAITVNTGSSGTKTISSTNISGTNTLSGTILLSNPITFDVTNSGGTLDATGVISGSGASLTKNGPGTLSLSNTGNTFGGATSNVTINAGVLSVPAGTSLGSNSNTIIFGGGTLRFTNASLTTTSTGRSMTFNSTAIVDTASAGTTSSSAVTFSGALGGSAGLTKIGTGMLILSGTSNSYAGATTVNGGTLRIGSTDSLPTGTNLVIDSANSSNFDLNGLNQTVAQLSNGTNGGGIVTNQTTGATSNSILTVTGTSSFGGVIQNGTGTTRVTNLTKSTGGTLTLTGNNTYTGATLISGGTLAASGTSTNRALGGTSGVTVNKGGTLLMGANNQFSSTTPASVALGGGSGSNPVLNAGGFSQGTSSTVGIGALTLNSNATIDLTGTSLLHFAASSTATGGTILSILNWSGTINTGGGTEELKFGSANSDLSYISQIQFVDPVGYVAGTYAATFASLNPGEVVPVPEPSTWIAGVLTLAVIGYMSRRRLAKADSLFANRRRIKISRQQD